MFSTAFSFLHFPMGTKSNEYFAVCNSRHVCCAISIDFFQQIVLLWVVHCMSIKGNCYENHKAISVAIFPMKPDLNISTFRCWCCYICLNRNSMPLSFRVKCPGWFRVKCPGCSCKMSRMLQATTWSQGWGWTATAGVRGCRRCQATAKLGARTTGSPTSSAIRFVWGGVSPFVILFVWGRYAVWSSSSDTFARNLLFVTKDDVDFLRAAFDVIRTALFSELM